LSGPEALREVFAQLAGLSHRAVAKTLKFCSKIDGRFPVVHRRPTWTAWVRSVHVLTKSPGCGRGLHRCRSDISRGGDDEAGDCAVRAIAIATQKPNREVHDALTVATVHHVANAKDGWAKLARRRGGVRVFMPTMEYIETSVPLI
jgi:hypothetical protein